MDVEKTASELKHCTEKLGDIAEGTNIALTEMRIQFDTMVQSQQEERIRMQELYSGERDKIRKHYGHIILALVLTIVLILGTVVGAVMYVFSNYDIMTGYVQDLYIGNDGTNTIYDGIHFNSEGRDDNR